MKFPLMRNNIAREDLDALIEYLKQDDPVLTNGPNVREFEQEWNDWLGTKYSVFRQLGCVGQSVDHSDSEASVS
jgi:CDP-6-deoxy-D-xylo-4-hexulose-3-dehydrase